MHESANRESIRIRSDVQLKSISYAQRIYKLKNLKLSICLSSVGI